MVVLCVLVIRVKLLQNLSQLIQSGQLDQSARSIKISSRKVIAVNIVSTGIFLTVSATLISMSLPFGHWIEPEVYTGIYSAQMAITLVAMQITVCYLLKNLNAIQGDDPNSLREERRNVLLSAMFFGLSLLLRMTMNILALLGTITAENLGEFGMVQSEFAAMIVC